MPLSIDFTDVLSVSRLDGVNKGTQQTRRRNAGDAAVVVRGSDGIALSNADGDPMLRPGAGLEELKESFGDALQSFVEILNVSIWLYLKVVSGTHRAPCNEISIFPRCISLFNPSI